MTKACLEEAMDNIRGAVMIAFPQGLPEWDLVRQALEGTEELAGTSVSLSCCDLTQGSTAYYTFLNGSLHLPQNWRIFYSCSLPILTKHY